MQLGTPERHSLLETQQQVSAIQGTLQETLQKLNTIEGKLDNLADLSASLRTIDAGLAKLLAAHEERQKEKEMKEEAE
jgi:hypothetical protein